MASVPAGTMNKGWFFLSCGHSNGYIKTLQFSQYTFHMEFVFPNQYTQKANWNAFRDEWLSNGLLSNFNSIEYFCLKTQVQKSFPMQLSQIFTFINFFQNPKRNKDINSCYKGKTWSVNSVNILDLTHGI